MIGEQRKLSVPTKHGPVEVDALVFGVWAVHQGVGDDEHPNDPEWPWSVTYVPLGLRLPWNWRQDSHAIAEAVCRRLNITHNAPPVDPKCRDEIRAVIDEIEAEFDREGGAR